jgi:hypothetical protein
MQMANSGLRCGHTLLLLILPFNLLTLLLLLRTSLLSAAQSNL